jgi:regulator of sigma E protease
MVIFQNIGWLLVLIGVMILIHELGHFWAARFFDVHVETFSFGFGPRLFGFKRGDTDFRFSLILFGGYVKMAGEQVTDEFDPRGFLTKPRWQRLIIAFAGPAMNIILAVALLTGLYMVKFPKPMTEDNRAIIGYVFPGGPAEKAGVKADDLVVQVEDKQNPTWEDVFMKVVASANRDLPMMVERGGKVTRVVVHPELDPKLGIGVAGWDEQVQVEVGSVVPGMDAEKKGIRAGDLLVSANGLPVRAAHTLHDIIRDQNGKPVELVYVRDGARHSVTVEPAMSSADGASRWLIGVQLIPRYDFVRLPFPQALRESASSNLKGATLIFQFLRGIMERRMSPKSLEGPIRIAQLSGEAAREGPIAFISLMATVSLNLAVFNLLPIPLLDGGVILLLLIEMLMRRDLSISLKETVLKLGFVFLMIVVAFVLYNDISKVLPG